MSLPVLPGHHGTQDASAAAFCADTAPNPVAPVEDRQAVLLSADPALMWQVLQGSVTVFHSISVVEELALIAGSRSAFSWPMWKASVASERLCYPWTSPRQQLERHHERAAVEMTETPGELQQQQAPAEAERGWGNSCRR